MKKAKLLLWLRTPSDTRDTASTVGSIVVPQKIALRTAMALEAGDEVPRSADRVLSSMLREKGEGYRFVQGHGVTIVYASGRMRTIRG